MTFCKHDRCGDHCDDCDDCLTAEGHSTKCHSAKFRSAEVYSAFFARQNVILPNAMASRAQSSQDFIVCNIEIKMAMGQFYKSFFVCIFKLDIVSKVTVSKYNSLPYYILSWLCPSSTLAEQRPHNPKIKGL